MYAHAQRSWFRRTAVAVAALATAAFVIAAPSRPAAAQAYPGYSYSAASPPTQTYPGYAYPATSAPMQTYPGYSSPAASPPTQTYPGYAYPATSAPTERGHGRDRSC